MINYELRRELNSSTFPSHAQLGFLTIFMPPPFSLKGKENGRQALFRHLSLIIFKFNADSPIMSHFING